MFSGRRTPPSPVDFGRRSRPAPWREVEEGGPRTDHGPCPLCGGVDRFALWPAKNIWHCRENLKGGDVIELERHLSGGSFGDAMRTPDRQRRGRNAARREPTPEEIAARAAREAWSSGDEEEAEEAARNASSVAKILARLQPVAGSPGRSLFVQRFRQDQHGSLGDQAAALEDIDTLGWCERTFFRQDNPSEPFHELDGQRLGAIVAILTDPVTGERTGGITRTFIHQSRKIGKARSLGGVGPVGDHPLVGR